MSTSDDIFSAKVTFSQSVINITVGEDGPDEAGVCTYYFIVEDNGNTAKSLSRYDNPVDALFGGCEHAYEMLLGPEDA